MVAQDAEEEQDGAARGVDAGFPLGYAVTSAAQGGCKLWLGHAQGDAQGGDGVVRVVSLVRAVWFAGHGCILALFGLLCKEKVHKMHELA